MPILIACSPSTGSSLLRRILNRHSQVFCGPETSLFAKKDLYTDWNAYKDLLLGGKSEKLVNMGWHHMKGLNLQDENNLSVEIINEIAASSLSFSDFINKYFKCLLGNRSKTIWAEKTPSNAFAIGDFINTYPNGKLIHVVRDPYDTVASLINRGMSVFNALCVYVLNVTQCLEYQTKTFYYEVRYEDLVRDPIIAISNLCSFLDIDFENQMIEASGNESGVDHMHGWNYKETSQIGNKSIGRFDKLPLETKQLVCAGMNGLKSNLDSLHQRYDDVFQALQYHKKEFEKPKSNLYFKQEIFKDKLKRFFKNSYFQANNYPVKWKN